jgi:hypothetical protein
MAMAIMQKIHHCASGAKGSEARSRARTHEGGDQVRGSHIRSEQPAGGKKPGEAGSPARLRCKDEPADGEASARTARPCYLPAGHRR